MHRFLHDTCLLHGRNIKTHYIGSISNLRKRKDWNSIKRERPSSFFTIHSQFIESQKLFGWKLQNQIKKCMNHFDRLRKFPWDHNWMKELLSETHPNPIRRTGRPVVTEQKTRSSAHEIDTRFFLDSKKYLFVCWKLRERQRHRQRRRCRSR